MGKAKQSERKSDKTKTESRRAGPPIYKRVGLHLPASRYTKKIKQGLRGNHKVAKLSSLALVAVIEYTVVRLLERSAKHVGDKKNIRPEHIHAALNDEESSIYGVFPKNVTGLH